MNNIFIKELYIAILLSKLSIYKPNCFYNNIETNEYLNDLETIIYNNTVHYVEDNNVQCFLIKYHNIIYIVINSTLKYESNNNLIKITKYINIHDGLYNQYLKIIDKIKENIEKLNDLNFTKNIYICGYYLGGALAQIISAFIAHKYRHQFLISCYSFSSPMIGNKYFKKFFNNNVNRIYNIYTYDTKLQSYYQYVSVSNNIILKNNSIYENDIEDNSLFAKKCLLYKFKNQKEFISTIDDYIIQIRNILLEHNKNRLKLIEQQ